MERSEAGTAACRPLSGLPRSAARAVPAAHERKVAGETGAWRALSSQPRIPTRAIGAGLSRACLARICLPRDPATGTEARLYLIAFTVPWNASDRANDVERDGIVTQHILVDYGALISIKATP